MQRGDRTLDDPTIDDRHQLVAVRRGQQPIEIHDATVFVEHPQQQLEMRACTHGARKRGDQLRIQTQMSGVDRIAQLSGNVDVGKPAHQADVVALINLDAISASILGCLAGAFGSGQRVHQLGTVRVNGRYTDADREVQPRFAMCRRQLHDPFAQCFGKGLRVIQVHRHEDREPVSGDPRRERFRRQTRTDELTHLRQH